MNFVYIFEQFLFFWLMIIIASSLEKNNKEGAETFNVLTTQRIECVSYII